MLQHSGLENRSAQENIFKIIKIVDTCILCRTLCKTWKQSLEKNSFSGWYLNEDIIQDFVLVQISFIKRWKLCIHMDHTRIPWLFPDFDSKLQNSLTCNEIPWLFPERFGIPWLLPDRGNPNEIVIDSTSGIISGMHRACIGPIREDIAT